ncbi:MAG: hypothetical protein M1135_02560 [Candidatus Omnitrophica bacterium]|nr:hypothetical protein [Candidatus Omnitrophota bacterium]
MRRKILIFLVVFLFPFFTTSAFSWMFLGYRFVKAPKAPADITPMTGGIFQVYLKNTSTKAVEIQNLKINGIDFNKLHKWIFRGKADLSKWWAAYPDPVPAGKVVTIKFRYYKILDFYPRINLTIETNIGNYETSVPLFQSPLRLKYVGFSNGLKRIYLFVQNTGNKRCRITDVYLNNKKYQCKWKTEILNPGGITYGKVLLEKSLSQGDFLVVRVLSNIPQWQSDGELRIFPSHFYFTGWNYEGVADQRNLNRIYFTTKYPVPEMAQDEPLDAPLSSQEVADRFLNLMTHNKNTQFAMQLTGFGENLTFADISDIHIHHHDPNLESEYVNKLNDPQPVWYLPQSTWQSWEGLDNIKNQPRQWAGSINDQDFSTYESAGRGAKAFDWFVYNNLWNQSMNYWGGLEDDGTFPDPIIKGMISNPVLWRKVAEVDGTFSLISKYLKISAPYFNKTNKDNIAVNAVLTWHNNIVITLVNYNHFNETGYIPRYNEKIEIPIPEWFNIKDCFSVNYYNGLTRLKWWIKNKKLGILVPYLKDVKLIFVSSNQKTTDEIQKIYEKIKTSSNYRFSNFNNIAYEKKPTPISSINKTKWLIKNLRFRTDVKIIPETSARNAIINFPLKIATNFKKNQILDGNSLIVIQTDKQGHLIKERKYSFSYSKNIMPVNPSGWSYGNNFYNKPKGVAGKTEVKNENEIIRFIQNAPFGPDYKCFWQGINFMKNWSSSKYPIVKIQYNVEKTHSVINFDLDFAIHNNKIRTGGAGIQLSPTIPPDTVSLGNGWKISEYNWVKGAETDTRENPKKLPAKYGHFWIQTVYYNDTTKGKSQIWFKSIELIGNNNIYIPFKQIKKNTPIYLQVYYGIKGEKTKNKSPNIYNRHLNTLLSSGNKLFKNIKIKQQCLFPNFSIRTSIFSRLIEIHPDVKSYGCVIKFYDKKNFLSKVIVPKEDGSYYTFSLPMDNNIKTVVIKVDFNNFIHTVKWFSYPSMTKIQPQKENYKNILWERNLKLPLYQVKTIENNIITGGGPGSTGPGILECLNNHGIKKWEITPPSTVRDITPIGKNKFGVIIGEWDRKTGNYSISKLIIYSIDGKKLWEKSFAPSYIRQLIVNKNKDKLAVSVWHSPAGLQSSVFVFTIKGKEINHFITNGVYATTIKFLGNNRIIVGSSPQGYLSCYNVNTGKGIFGISGNANNIPGIAVGGDNIYFISYNLYCINEKGKKIWEKFCGMYPRVISISPDGKYIATGTLDGTFAIFDKQGQEIKKIEYKNGIIDNIKAIENGFIFTVDRFFYTPENGWQNRTETVKVNNQGGVLWKSITGERPFTDMATISATNNEVYISSYDGKIRRIQ